MERSAEKLAALRQSIATYEFGNGTASTVPLGYGCADAVLRGGLRHGALHEVYAGDASQGAAATGFASGFAARLASDKTVFWIGTDYAALEHGALNAAGLLELGLDPSRFVVLRMAKGDEVLHAAGDVLSCAAVGAVVLEIESTLKALDLTASRRLSLAAVQRDVSTILLRLGAKPEASAAETRWLVHAAASPPPLEEGDWGAPSFDVQLLRNRHGELGNWRLEWKCNDGFFGDRSDSGDTADSRRLVPTTADGPLATQDKVQRAV